MTLDIFSLTQRRGKVTQLALIAAGRYKYTSLIHSPVPRPLSWCRHNQLTWQLPTQGVTGQQREAFDAASWVCLLVPPCWKGLLLMALSLVLLGLLTFPFRLPTLSMTWYKTCTLGKKEPERLFSNHWLDSQGVFQHGSQRLLHVYWEWEVQILSRTLARKLPLSVFLAASKWEGIALKF